MSRAVTEGFECSAEGRWIVDGGGGSA